MRMIEREFKDLSMFISLSASKCIIFMYIKCIEHVETNITQKPQTKRKTKPNPMRAHAHTIVTTYIVYYLQNTCLLIYSILVY